MNNITYAVSVDVNSPTIPYNVYVASVLDSNVRYLEITLYQNGNVITLSNTATATASLVTDDVLIDDSVECTISNNIITVPLEDLQRHGNLDVQVTVTEDTKVLAIPFPIQVRVTPNIAENAQIDENSLGSYAEVVHEISEARGSYTNLKERLDHTDATDEQVAKKADKTYVDAQNAEQNAAIAAKADKTYVDSQNAAQNSAIEGKASKVGIGSTNILISSTNDGNIKRSGYEVTNNSNAIKNAESAATFVPTARAVGEVVGGIQNQIESKADKSEIPDVSGKADKATTLAGYGITDAYTKDESDVKFFEFLDGTFAGDPNISPTLLVDNTIDATYNPNGHYILYYIDSDGGRHNVFDFSNYFADIENVYTKSELEQMLGGFEVIGNYKNDVITGSYYNENGNVVNNAKWSRTPLYPVNPGDVVVVTKPYYQYIACFDSNGEFLSANNSQRERATFTVPSDAAYIGLNIYPQYLDDHNCTVNGEVLGVKYGFVLPDSSIADWRGKTYISHGDSITWQDGREYGQGAHQGEIARGYQTVVKEKLELGTHNNQGKSGWSMAIVNGNGCVNTVKAIADYTVYGLCTIACGTNDFKLNVPLGTLGAIDDTNFDTATFIGAYREAIEYILTSSPTIRVVLMTPIQRNNGGYDVNTTNTAGYKLIDYVNAVKRLGEMYSLPVCDMYSNSGITKKTLSTYTMDGLHPNDEGYERMGAVLAGFLKSGGGCCGVVGMTQGEVNAAIQNAVGDIETLLAQV